MSYSEPQKHMATQQDSQSEFSMMRPEEWVWLKHLAKQSCDEEWGTLMPASLQSYQAATAQAS